MESVKVLAKGQIVIPGRLRKKHNIKTGQEIGVFEYDGLIYLVPQFSDPVSEALGACRT
jgi:AbrB family looped-hinge helix DNA binding protein